MPRTLEINPPSPQDCLIEAAGLGKSFRQVDALDGLDLRIGPGEVVALLGSNGSGKSTTFRLLLNIYRASRGEASLLGVPSGRLDGMDFDRIAFISESQKLPAWMNVRQFLRFCSGLHSGWDSEMADRLLEAFALPPDQKIKHLSRGQRMKAAIASNLPAKPALLMLDEPFSGLDVETRDQVGALLVRLARDESLSIVLTTHDVEEVEPVATRLVLLRQGKKVEDLALADFIGGYARISFPGADPASIPDGPVRILGQKRDSAGAPVGILQWKDTDEESLRNHYAGLTLEISKPSVREILTARAFPL